MTGHESNRWERARQDVIRRWRNILTTIEARDESKALALANVMDEFCDEATLAREVSAGGRRPAGSLPLKVATVGSPAGSRCFFCRGFTDLGGCFGLLDELNRAVVKGEWDRARLVAQSYILRLESMDFDSVARTQVH